MSEPFADEARRAWRAEVRRRLGLDARDRLAALVLATGLVSLLLVAARIAVAIQTTAAGVVVASSTVVALAVGLGVPAWLSRRTRRRLEREVDEARARAGSVDCPRCAAPLFARGPDVVDRRTCGRCAAPLLEAEGMLVVDLADARHRTARWRAAARHRLRHVRPAALEGPVLWLVTAVLALGVLVGGARTAGLSATSPWIREVVFGEPEDAPMDGTARARRDDDILPVGTPTRPRAPALVGTQVLARRGRGPWHQLAVIVRVSDARAFVVFADGDADWVRRDGLLAPEIAVGDRVEHFHRGGFVAGQVSERRGPAVRVDATWTSVARLRFRVDASHATGRGRDGDVPLDAWVEVEDEPGTWRPGITVHTEGLEHVVALAEGGVRTLAHDRVRAQGIGPGVRVFIDGRPGPRLVAARIGDALAVVDANGVRSWAALSQVRRR